MNISNHNRNEEKQAWIRIVVKAIQTNFFYYYHKVHKVTILDELPLLQSLSSSSSNEFHSIGYLDSSLSQQLTFKTGVVLMSGPMNDTSIETRLQQDPVCVVHVMLNHAVGLYSKYKYLLNRSVMFYYES